MERLSCCQKCHVTPQPVNLIRWMHNKYFTHDTQLIQCCDTLENVNGEKATQALKNVLK